MSSSLPFLYLPSNITFMNSCLIPPTSPFERHFTKKWGLMSTYRPVSQYGNRKKLCQACILFFEQRNKPYIIIYTEISVCHWHTNGCWEIMYLCVCSRTFNNWSYGGQVVKVSDRLSHVLWLESTLVDSLR